MGTLIFLAHQIVISIVFTHEKISISSTPYQPLGKDKNEQRHVNRVLVSLTCSEEEVCFGSPPFAILMFSPNDI